MNNYTKALQTLGDYAEAQPLVLESLRESRQHPDINGYNFIADFPSHKIQLWAAKLFDYADSKIAEIYSPLKRTSGCYPRRTRRSYRFVRFWASLINPPKSRSCKTVIGSSRLPEREEERGGELELGQLDRQQVDWNKEGRIGEHYQELCEAGYTVDSWGKQCTQPRANQFRRKTEFRNGRKTIWALWNQNTVSSSTICS